MPTDTATAQFELKDALYEAALILFAEDDAQVVLGHPGINRENPDIIAFTRMRTEQEVATQSPRRSRNEFIYLTVMLSCWRPGETDDRAASAAVTDYMRRLENHVRVTDTTLSGKCNWCFVDSTETAGSTDVGLLAAGRLVESEITFKAFVRITT